MRYSNLQLLTTGIRSCTNYIKSPALSSLHIRSMATAGVPSETAKLQNDQSASVSSSNDLGIENTNISTASGVNLDDQQKIIVGSVLDLFAGRPSLKKLGLWTDDATFQDNLTHATGRKQYSAQWYGLQTAFSEIERLHHAVTSSGNPITMDLKTRYVVKGINKEQTIESVVKIHTTPDGKIKMVEDRWNGNIPDGVFAKAMRNLNAVVVPAFVSIPKNEEEDAKKGN